MANEKLANPGFIPDWCRAHDYRRNIQNLARTQRLDQLLSNYWNDFRSRGWNHAAAEIIQKKQQ